MNHRHFVRASVLFAVSLSAFSQNAGTEAVVWSTQVTPLQSANGERLYHLQLDGRIAPHYIVYGSDFNAQLGPNPTRLRFADDSGITPQGPLESVGTHKGTDEVFKTDYTYFRGEAKLSQVIAVAAGTEKIAGTIRGQTCYEANGTCQLFSTSFDIKLP